MTDTSECRSLVRYLAGRDPTAYVVRCYQRSVGALAGQPMATIDRVLLAAARLGSLPARAADGYARWFRPTGGYRRRVTLALAILENTPDLHREMNDTIEGTPVTVLARLAVRLAGSAAAIALGIVLFGPVHVFSSVVPTRGA